MNWTGRSIDLRSNIGAIELNYLIDGKPNLPWLVFSNSVATDTSLWDAQVPRLEDRFQVLRYDHRGHGLSDVPEGEYSIDMIADDLFKLLESLNITKASFVGISMGGMTVLTLAKRHPEMVEKLIVCDCGPSASPASAQQWLHRIESVSTEGMESIVSETLGRWFTKDTLESKDPLLDKVAEMIRKTPARGFIGAAHALATFDLRPGLASLAVPTLFLAGEHDAVVGGTRALSETVPNAKFKAVSKAGHLCNLENPKEFLSTLLEFL